ncbi:MAG: 50S ribosomal protein L29 [Pseudomonadota bacterium]
MNIDEIRKMKNDELKAELLNIRKELFNLRLQSGAGQQVRPHLMHDAKKTIARIKTILNERDLAGEAK